MKYSLILLQMPMIFKIESKDLKNSILDSTIETVTLTTNDVYLSIREFSPIDTGKYISGHINKGVRKELNRIIGEIENIGSYSESVEAGFRKTAVNWNLVNIGQVYNSVGANVYEKAILKNKDIFFNRLLGR